MLPPNCFGCRAAPLVSTANEKHVEPLALLLRHVVREFLLCVAWILDAKLLSARKLYRPRVEGLPVLLALEFGGHVDLGPNG